MQIIDPLKIKISQKVVVGDFNFLTDIKDEFGRQIEILKMDSYINSIKLDPDRIIFIDLTPFIRINCTYLNSFFRTYEDTGIHFFLMLDDKTGLEEIISISKEFNNLDYITFKDTKFVCSSDEKFCNYCNSFFLKYSQEFPDFSDQYLFRWFHFSERILMEILASKDIIDIPLGTNQEQFQRRIGGRYYRIMDNEMLVSCYIRLKFLGDCPQKKMDLIYELIIILENYFYDETKIQYDYIVVSSNTTLFVISLLQQILGIPILFLDKLGPKPSVIKTNERLRSTLINKNVIYIEEMSATGNQIDRTILMLSQMYVDLKRIITIYNLKVGIPQLIQNYSFISLCYPKEELKYEYRSQ